MKPFDRQLADRLAEAFAAVLGRPAGEIDPAVRPATDPRFGDYQSNAAMALAKQTGANPRELAARVVAAARLDDLCEPPDVAGPGFINLRLRPAAVASALPAMAGDPRLGVDKAASAETIVIDYSSPNIAKEMHVGHLRSTVLGDALARILECLGHNVVRRNHVGDWGTHFGMLVAYMRDREPQHDGLIERAPELRDLDEFYRRAQALFESDPEFADIARRLAADFQRDDRVFTASWMRFRRISLGHCLGIYERLGVRLTEADIWGESEYRPARRPRVAARPGQEVAIDRGRATRTVEDVVEELRRQGLLTESQGALCVFLDEFKGKDGKPLPLIVQKTDGGFLYATTDLAALWHRVTHDHADRILYVTDARQSLHFQQVFAVGRKAGFAPETVQLVHVAFGTIQGPDGKPFKTRSGDTVRLADLLDEAERRALAIVEGKNPDLPEDQKNRVARAVGIGAVKYFDLSNNRLSDYRFDWDQMLSLTGNTAPYLQYAYARIRSIFRKGGLERGEGQGTKDEGTTATGPAAGGIAPGSPTFDPRPSTFDLSRRAPDLDHPNELALAKHLVRYGEILYRVVEDYRPNILCDYLYELAGRFTTFYENCPVLKAAGLTRADRLGLCRLTAQVLRHGLGLLGIEVLEQM